MTELGQQWLKVPDGGGHAAKIGGERFAEALAGQVQAYAGKLAGDFGVEASAANPERGRA